MKRSAWRYLWTAAEIRNRLLITLGLLISTGWRLTCRCRASIAMPLARSWLAAPRVVLAPW